ncbi:MAG: AI-2E family transporter [Nanoarchaeota archaeon]|nr:AI-2E family transporter [Nanoarchaeota archaeon]
MALSTENGVWKGVSIVFFFLTAIFSLLFYLKTTFVVVVLGFLIIAVRYKLAHTHAQGKKKLHLTGWKATVYSWSMVIFWSLLILWLLSSSVNQLTDVFGKASNDQVIAKAYLGAKDAIPESLASLIDFESIFKQAGALMFSLLSGFLSGLTAFLFQGVLIIPLMVYMFTKRGDAIRDRLYELAPAKFRKSVHVALSKVANDLSDFFSAKLLESFVIGVICCTGFFLFGLKGWLLLGALAGFLNIIPFLGPIIGAIPAVIIGLLQHPIIAVWVLITIVVAQLVDSLYLIPFMISGKVRMEPLVGIFLVVVGSQVLGIMGMIFAIPVYIIYNIILRETYRALVRIYG